MDCEERQTRAETISTPRQPGLSDLQEVLEAGLRHHQAGQLAEAERFYRLVLAVDARHADAWHLLGVIANQVGQNDIALEAIGKAIEINPMLAVYHCNLGKTLQDLGRLDDAVATYNTAIGFAPDFAEAHYNLGQALQELGRLDDAVAAYNAAIRCKVDFVEALYNLGNALQELGRLDDAVAAYNNAICLKPDHVPAYSNLGNALQELGRFDDAVAAYNTAIGYKPDFAEAYSNLGNALKSLGCLDDAVAAYNNAIRCNPDYAEAHSNLGTVLKDLGRLGDAVAAYNNAIRCKPDFTEAHFNLGLALLHSEYLSNGWTEGDRPLQGGVKKIPGTRLHFADQIRRFGWEIGEHTYGIPIVFEENMAKLIIGKYTSLASGLQIALGNHRSDVVSTYPFVSLRGNWPSAPYSGGDHSSKGDVRIGNDVWIGASAFVSSGVTIGDGAIIGAHAVVTKDVPPYAVVVGNPGRVVRQRFSDAIIKKLLELEWWNWPDEVVDAHLPLMMQSNIEAFLAVARQVVPAG